MSEQRRTCELCHHTATVYCPSDAAYLCSSCDHKVHRANFLVARHLRHHLTSPSPSPSPSSSSSCISSTSTTPSTTVSASAKPSTTVSASASVTERIEGVLINWCRRMEVEEESKVVRVAVEVLQGKMTVMPLRVMLATAFWVGVTATATTTATAVAMTAVRRGELLKRLEQISGVPAKLILSMEIRWKTRTRTQTRVGRSRKSSPVDYQEGWAESY